jgi:hypothetical protein
MAHGRDYRLNAESDQARSIREPAKPTAPPWVPLTLLLFPTRQRSDRGGTFFRPFRKPRPAGDWANRLLADFGRLFASAALWSDVVAFFDNPAHAMVTRASSIALREDPV